MTEKLQKGIHYPAISVVPIIHDGDGKYLFELRSQQCRDERGVWNVAGGGSLEHGETLEAGLKREIKEEVNATAFNIEHLGHNEVFREVDGATSHWIRFDFKVQVDPDEVKLMEPDKMDDLQWFTLEELPEPTHSQWGVFLEKNRAYL